MSPRCRRTVLTGLASLVVLSGCSLDEGEQDPASAPSATETTVQSPSPSEPESPTQPATATSTPGPFDDLTVETERTWCPSDDHWEPYYHRTPQFPPERPSRLTRETVVEYVRSYEEFALTYLATAEYGRQSPVPPTATDMPGVPSFPDTEMRESSTAVLTALEDAFVVQISYIRSIEGESRGRYTVNYYVSTRQAVRAEAEGDVSPGPNPTKSGSILDC